MAATAALRLLLLATSAAGAALAQDVAFEPEIVSQFLEYSETPLKTVTQTGAHKTPKQPVRDIAYTDSGKAKADLALPLMHIVTAPGCGACNRLKTSVNRGIRVRQLLKSVNVVYLNGPGGMPWTDKWQELGHEGYIPQVYFYSRDGKPLHVINEGKDSWNWHSFTNEDALAKAITAMIERDEMLAAGEEYEQVAPLPGQNSKPKKAAAPAPAPGMNTRKYMYTPQSPPQQRCRRSGPDRL